MNETPRVIVTPILPGVPARKLIDLTRAIATDRGRAIVLSIVEVPEELSLSEGASVARRRREMLRRLGGDEAEAPSVELVVRAARTVEEGVEEAVRETNADALLMGWRGPVRSEERLRRWSLDALILSPPCDLTVFKAGRQRDRSHRSKTASALRRAPLGGEAPELESTVSSGAEQLPEGWPPTKILLPIRGGLHANLALEQAHRLAAYFGAGLTVMRITRPSLAPQPNPLTDLPGLDGWDNLQTINVTSASVEDAIAREAESHDLLILGASARGPRTSHLLGYIPERLAARVSCNVMVVKTAEPLSPEMFGVTTQPHEVTTEGKTSISRVVDQWFAENTFHSHEFADLRRLMKLKERQAVTISLALPALNEEATVGKIISTIKQRLVDDVPLIDEMILIDSNSEDRTRDIAQDLGIPVFIHQEILPQYGSCVGKGEALWKSLFVTTGEIVVWIDSDITDIHPKFVYGLVGPLLTQPRVDFVKGYYRRPLRLGGGTLTTGGGRVTELTARPLINLFYPHLSGLVQPLAGEMAGRRALLEQLPFFTGYGVETGLLIDILERYGLNHLAQTDLENRIHRNQDMISLSKMAFAIVQVVMRRLEDRQHIQLLDEINTTMKLIHYSPQDLFLEVKEIQEHERPPMAGIPEYALRQVEAETVEQLAGAR